MEVWNTFHFFKFWSPPCGIIIIDFSCVLCYSLPSQNLQSLLFTAFRTQGKKTCNCGIYPCWGRKGIEPNSTTVYDF